MYPSGSLRIIILRFSNKYFLAILKNRLPILARLGCLTLCIDHKFVKGRQGDLQNKALGIVAIISSENGSRKAFTLGYLSTDDATDDETIILLEECFKKYDLADPFKQMHIPFVTDAQLRFAIERIYEKANIDSLKSICFCHNFGNLDKACIRHLPNYLEDSAEQKEQLKKNFEVAKDLDNYFNALEVHKNDRDLVGNLSIPNWKELSQDEQNSTQLKYQPIPNIFDVRFRNQFQRTKGLLSRWQELERIKSNFNHPMHNSVSQLDVSQKTFQYLNALFDMRKHLIGLIDYYEKDSNFQSTESINSMLYLFEYALDLENANKYEIGIKMAFLDGLTEQFVSHRTNQNDDGTWSWVKSRVPTRIGRIDKIGAFAFPGNQKLLLPRLIKRLKEARKSYRPLKAKFQVTNQISCNFLQDFQISNY